MQGSLKCFDIKTGKVVTHRTIKVIPMPADVIKTVNRWGQGQKAISFGNKLEFLNRTKTHFDWENEELDLDDLVDEKKVHLLENSGTPIYVGIHYPISQGYPGHTLRQPDEKPLI